MTLSLRARLALWYGALAGLTVLLVCGLLYATHGRARYEDLDQMLASAGDHLAEEYVSAGASLVLPELSAPNLVARIYDSTGRLVSASAGDALAPVSNPQVVADQGSPPAFGPFMRLAPALTATSSVNGVFGLLAGKDGARWRAYATPVGQSGSYLVTVTSLGSLDAAMDRFLRLLLLLATLGSVSALAVGGLIAGRALRPVSAVTETADEIARTRSFNRRVPAGPGQDEMGRLAGTLNRMLASLEDAHQAQQRFVSDASHELRAPLTAIQANLEILERRPDLAPAAREEAIGEASREARRLARLVADLLALARADAGVALRRDHVELDRVLLDSLVEARHLSRGQRLAVGGLEPLEIEGDADRLKQLLLILLDNAIRYTPTGGTITVGLRRVGPRAALTIVDTGIGIAPADIPHVFERFYRADPARARDSGGTGLGLAIARAIVEQHGGDIAFASEPGKGTTVTVHLLLPR